MSHLSQGPLPHVVFVFVTPCSPTASKQIITRACVGLSSAEATAVWHCHALFATLLHDLSLSALAPAPPAPPPTPVRRAYITTAPRLPPHTPHRTQMSLRQTPPPKRWSAPVLTDSPATAHRALFHQTTAPDKSHMHTGLHTRNKTANTWETSNQDTGPIFMNLLIPTPRSPASVPTPPLQSTCQH